MPQEIGRHTFSHVVVGDPSCSEACFDSELKKCRELAARTGVQLQSFVFPKDRFDHLDVLRENGFTCFRGRLARWYIGFPRTLRRVQLNGRALSLPCSVGLSLDDQQQVIAALQSLRRRAR